MTTEVRDTAAAPPADAANAAPPEAPAQPLPATDQPESFPQPASTDQPAGQEPTETEGPEAPAAPPAKPRLADLGLTDEDLESDERIQGLIARREESVRQRAERIALARAAADRSQFVASGMATDRLRELAVRAASTFDDNGQPQLDAKAVDGLTTDILSSGAGHAVSVFGAILGEDLPEGFEATMTAEERSALEAAKAQVDANPLDPSPLTREWLRLRDRARDATLEAGMLERVERQAAQRAEARAAEETARQTREQLRAAPGPTNVNGTPVGRNFDTSTLEGIGQALQNGWDPSEDEFAEAYARAANR